jgi:hypothetical protein
VLARQRDRQAGGLPKKAHFILRDPKTSKLIKTFRSVFFINRKVEGFRPNEVKF